eukprot:11660746-Alexandrium_andersonii.AAC.1
MDPDVRLALHLDSILDVLLRAEGAEWLAHAFGLAADYRRVCQGRWGPLACWNFLMRRWGLERAHDLSLIHI